MHGRRWAVLMCASLLSGYLISTLARSKPASVQLGTLEKTRMSSPQGGYRPRRELRTDTAPRRGLDCRSSVFPWQPVFPGRVKIEPATRQQLQPLSALSVLDDLAILTTSAIFQPKSTRLAREIQNYLYKKIINRYGPSNANQNVLFLAQEPSDDDRPRVLGCVGLEVLPVTIEGKPKGDDIKPRPLLEFLAVDEQDRGRGVGKSLIKRCEEQVKEWGYNEIILQVAMDNNVAIGLYKKMGYTVVGEDNTILQPKEGGIFGGMDFDRAVYLCMRKELDAGPTFRLPKLF